MNRFLTTLVFGFSLHAAGFSDDSILPDEPMGKQLKWADAAKTDSERATRLEAFWLEYLPQEDGGISPDRIGYGDGSHVTAIVHCAWQLTRAYIATDQQAKALEMVNWLAKHESKTGLAPVTTSGEQGAAGQPAKRPESK